MEVELIKLPTDLIVNMNLTKFANQLKVEVKLIELTCGLRFEVEIKLKTELGVNIKSI